MTITMYMDVCKRMLDHFNNRPSDIMEGVYPESELISFLNSLTPYQLDKVAFITYLARNHFMSDAKTREELGEVHG